MVPKVSSVSVPISMYELLDDWTESMVRLVTGKSNVLVPTVMVAVPGIRPSPMVRSLFTHETAVMAAVRKVASTAGAVFLKSIVLS